MTLQIVQFPEDDVLCAHDLVRFTHAVYALPSVRGLLNAFTDESIFDVSLLLLSIWAGFIGMPRLDRTFLLPLMNWLARWHRTVSAPLSHCMHAAIGSPVYEGVVACDQLNARMITIFIIDALRIAGLVPQVAENTLDNAKSNLALYCKLLNLVPSGIACHRVRQLLTEIYNQRDGLMQDQMQ